MRATPRFGDDRSRWRPWTVPSPPPGSASAPDTISPRDQSAGAEPAELARLAERVALDAAALLRDGLGGRRQIENKSTTTDHVTEMDRAAERLIVDALLAARPDDGVLGEEGANRTGTSSIRWVIDPIDGTTNYVYGFPAFAVSIAAQRCDPDDPTSTGTAVAGVVVDVAAGDVFAASAGGGATRNGAPIRCSEVNDLALALVATGFGYDRARRARQARVLTEVLPRVRDIRRMGAASLDLCSVACGRVDAYFEKGLAPWDHAAGGLIASESGAQVVDLEGAAPRGDLVIAAPAELVGPLTELLRAARAGEV
jgi:myo-inositol-1(or 4)-monophosphatase